MLEIPAVFEYPIIEYTKNMIKTKTDAVYVAMSGSGPTVFGLYFSEDKCRVAAAALEGEATFVYAARLHRETMERGGVI